MPSGLKPRRIGRAERFAHGADIGVRGIGPSLEAAFEQAAVALSGAIAPISKIRRRDVVTIECQAPKPELLFVDWLNAVIYQMAVRHMLFGRFAVRIEGIRLRGEAWGEPVDPARHEPSVEPKGATYTALRVERMAGGDWVAQCVVDV